eukprot:1166986-Amphidinium_carterae.1
MHGSGRVVGRTRFAKHSESIETGLCFEAKVWRAAANNPPQAISNLLEGSHPVRACLSYRECPRLVHQTVVARVLEWKWLRLSERRL